MMINFSEKGHPVFPASSALERRSLRSKGQGKMAIHFCGDHETVEVILCTIYFGQSAQCLRSSGGYVRRAGLENFWMFRKYGETCCSEQFGDHGDANRIVDNEQTTSDQ